MAYYRPFSCYANHITFAIARLESIRAEDAIVRFDVADVLGPDRIFRNVEEAVRHLNMRPRVFASAGFFNLPRSRQVQVQRPPPSPIIE